MSAMATADPSDSDAIAATSLQAGVRRAKNVVSICLTAFRVLRPRVFLIPDLRCSLRLCSSNGWLLSYSMSNGLFLFHFILLVNATVFDQGSKRFGHRPGLRGAATGLMRQLRIENLRHLSQTGGVEVGLQPIEKGTSRFLPGTLLPICFDPRRYKRTEEKRPHSPLVIGAIPVGHTPFVPRAIPRVVGRQRPKTDRCQQLIVNNPQHLFGLFTRDEIVAERQGIQLIRP